MPDQLLTYYIENPLMIISINSGNWRLMVIRLAIETRVIGKGVTKKRGVKRGVGGKRYGGCWVLCLGVFLLL
jgi:hypothetical protein